MRVSSQASNACAIKPAYDTDGFWFPHRVMSESEAAEILADLQAAEAEVARDRTRLSMLRTSPARVLPRVDRLTRHPALIAAISQLIGPDLLVWGSALFIKEPKSTSYVSWHQDLNYWGLDGEDEVTAWVALTPATVENGCMRFVPGSHRRKIVPHVDSFAKDNLLSRGQEIAVAVDETEAVNVVLRPGEASLHHGHMFHASSPNGTDGRRVGIAIRYLATSMRQISGEKIHVTLVSGQDAYGHFEVLPPPAGRLLEEDFERVRRNIELRKRVVYSGVAPERIRATPKT